MAVKLRQTWLDQWLDHDSYPTRPVRYRHIDDINANVPGGIHAVLTAVNQRGWTALRIDRHIVILETNRITLLTDSIEISR